MGAFVLCRAGLLRVPAGNGPGPPAARPQFFRNSSATGDSPRAASSPGPLRAHQGVAQGTESSASAALEPVPKLGRQGDLEACLLGPAQWPGATT
eukprot:scaffold80477_cov71-Phaeocystis_antarctica.AAC.7